MMRAITSTAQSVMSSLFLICPIDVLGAVVLVVVVVVKSGIKKSGKVWYLYSAFNVVYHHLKAL